MFDGIAYVPQLAGSRDTCILEAGEEEGIYTAELNLSQLRKYREQEVHGNAYRRPSAYTLLTSQEVRAPFIRESHRK